jgi:hypothetical protein
MPMQLCFVRSFGTLGTPSVNGGGFTDSCNWTSICGCLRTKREISGAKR